jgi:uncharacterized protein YlxW (UPF0749 family)
MIEEIEKEIYSWLPFLDAERVVKFLHENKAFKPILEVAEDERDQAQELQDEVDWLEDKVGELEEKIEELQSKIKRLQLIRKLSRVKILQQKEEK